MECIRLLESAFLTIPPPANALTGPVIIDCSVSHDSVKSGTGRSCFPAIHKLDAASREVTCKMQILRHYWLRNHAQRNAIGPAIAMASNYNYPPRSEQQSCGFVTVLARGCPSVRFCANLAPACRLRLLITRQQCLYAGTGNGHCLGRRRNASDADIHLGTNMRLTLPPLQNQQSNKPASAGTAEIFS